MNFEGAKTDKECLIRVLRGCVSGGQSACALNRMYKWSKMVTGTCNFGLGDTILEEGVDANGEVVFLRIRFISDLVLPDNVQFGKYKNVRELEVSCAIPWSFLLELSASMKKLKKIRIGSGTFQERKHPLSHDLAGIRRSPHVKHLVISYDPDGFQKLSKDRQHRMANLYQEFLNKVCAFMSGLTRVDFKLPTGTDMDSFMSNTPSFLRNAIKSVRMNKLRFCSHVGSIDDVSSTISDDSLSIASSGDDVENKLSAIPKPSGSLKKRSGIPLKNQPPSKKHKSGTQVKIRTRPQNVVVIDLSGSSDDEGSISLDI